MQNLPVQFTQAPSVKNGSDVSPKNDVLSSLSNSKPNSNANQLFQNVLSNQVQNKRAQAVAAAVNNTAANKPAATNQNAVKPSNVDAAAKNKAENPQAGQVKQDLENNVRESASLKAKASAESDASAKQLAKDKLGKDKTAELQAQEMMAAMDPALASQQLLAMPITPDQAATASTESAVPDSAIQQPLSTLDAALNKALAQSKTAPADTTAKPEADAGTEAGIATETQADKLGADTRWLDAVLPNAKQLAGEDLDAKLGAKLAAKDMLASSTALNEINAPAIYQPSAVVNAAQPGEIPGRSNVISAYPGKTGWDQAISQKVMWMVGGGEQSATLTLNPPDLGPLQVVIHVHNDKANTTFISDNADVRQALENGLSHLRDKMNESGIELGQTNINSGSQAQSQAQQEFLQAAQNRGKTQVNDNTPAQGELAANAQAPTRVSNGLVDTFA